MSVDFHFASEDVDEHIQRIRAEVPIGRFSPNALNKLVDGIFPGRYMIIEAEPGGGKTTILCQIAVNASLNGFVVIVVTLEIASHQWVAKSHAMLSKGELSVKDIIAGNKPEAFSNAHDIYRSNVAPNLVFSEGPMEPDDIAALVANVKHATDKPVLLLVDYLQVVSTNLADERLAVKDIAYRLRKIANREDIQVIAASSLNRTSYGKTPTIGSSSGSGAIEYSADVVLHMREIKPKTEDNDISPIRTVEVTALKNRYGQKGSIQLLFDTEHATFLEH